MHLSIPRRGNGLTCQIAENPAKLSLAFFPVNAPRRTTDYTDGTDQRSIFAHETRELTRKVQASTGVFRGLRTLYFSKLAITALRDARDVSQSRLADAARRPELHRQRRLGVLLPVAGEF